MAKAAIFWIDGLEETEAVTIADLLRRGSVELQIVSLMDSTTVTGKHDIALGCDKLLAELDTDVEMYIIPGGTIDYLQHADFLDVLKEGHAEGKKMAAICAAPAVFGSLGFLQDKRAACYPGMEGYMKGATVIDATVVTDGNITTSQGPATAIDFGLELLRILEGEAVSKKIATDFLASV
jgi:DJ-1 family protein